MGSEISTVGGAIATAATGLAVGVTFGQLECVNSACCESAKFTGTNFMDSNVRRIGEFTGTGIATVATLGLIDSVNEHAAHTGKMAGKKLLSTASDVVDGVPGAGHIKGIIHYKCGDKAGGDQAMKSASRTIGVVVGAVAGIEGGPVGMVMGGIVGGAYMDTLTTVVESGIHDEFKPNGQIAAWNSAINGQNAQERLQGIVGAVASPVLDGLSGYYTGKAIQDARLQAEYKQNVAKFLEEGGNMDLMEALDTANKIKPKAAVIECPEKKEEPRPNDIKYGDKCLNKDCDIFHPDDKPVFRGDKIIGDPDVQESVFKRGIGPGSETFKDVKSHIINPARNGGPSTNFISTSKRFHVAKGFSGKGPDGGVLKIHPRNGIDIMKVTRNLNEHNLFPKEFEVSIPGHIPPHLIEGILVGKEGAKGMQWIHNPNFRPDPKLNYVFQAKLPDGVVGCAFHCVPPGDRDRR